MVQCNRFYCTNMNVILDPSKGLNTTESTMPAIYNVTSGDFNHLGLVSLVVLSILTNALVIAAVRTFLLLHVLTYYFLTSLSAVHILMSGSAMVLTLLINIQGDLILGEDICKLWTTLDFFFCNNTFLHLAFLNMDSYLHLKDPMRHGRSSTTCSICLWLSAPWAISIVQGLAQFMLSQGDHGVTEKGLCIVSDKNFILLGTLFSYLIPAVAATLFYSLSVWEIFSKRKRQVEGSDGSIQNVFPTTHSDATEEEWSTCSERSEEHEHEVQQAERVELSVVKATPTNNSTNAEQPPIMTSLQEHDITATVPNHSNLTCCSTDMLNAYYADQILSVDMTANSCTLLLRDTPDGPTVDQNASVSVTEQDVQNQLLRDTRFTSKWMFLILLSMLCLWTPLLISNLIYGLCKSCQSKMNIHEINTLKWLAYSSGLTGPIIYTIFSDHMRHGFINVIVCKCLKKQ